MWQCPYLRIQPSLEDQRTSSLAYSPRLSNSVPSLTSLQNCLFSYVPSSINDNDKSF